MNRSSAELRNEDNYRRMELDFQPDTRSNGKSVWSGTEHKDCHPWHRDFTLHSYSERSRIVTLESQAWQSSRSTSCHSKSWFSTCLATIQRSVRNCTCNLTTTLYKRQHATRSLLYNGKTLKIALWSHEIDSYFILRCTTIWLVSVRF